MHYNVLALAIVIALVLIVAYEFKLLNWALPTAWRKYGSVANSVGLSGFCGNRGMIFDGNGDPIWISHY